MGPGEEPRIAYIESACAKNQDRFLYYRLLNVFDIYLIDMKQCAFDVFDDLSWFDFLRNNGSIAEIINQKFSLNLAALAVLALLI
jgi:hypothetical protein